MPAVAGLRRLLPGEHARLVVVLLRALFRNRPCIVRFPFVGWACRIVRRIR